jgi:hypothetical protein
MPSVTTTEPEGGDILAHARQLYSEEGARGTAEFEGSALFRSEGDRKGEAITIGLIATATKSSANTRRPSIISSEL